MNVNQQQWRLLTFVKSNTLFFSPHFPQIFNSALLSDKFLIHAVNSITHRKTQKYSWTVFYSINDLNLPAPSKASSSLLKDYPLLLQGWRFTKLRDTWEVLKLFTYQALNLLKSIVMESKSQPILEKSCVQVQFSLQKTTGESARRWACFLGRKKRWKAAAIIVKDWQAATATLHYLAARRDARGDPGQQVLSESGPLSVTHQWGPESHQNVCTERNYHPVLWGPFPLLRLCLPVKDFKKKNPKKHGNFWKGLPCKNKT